MDRTLTGVIGTPPTPSIDQSTGDPDAGTVAATTITNTAGNPAKPKPNAFSGVATDLFNSIRIVETRLKEITDAMQKSLEEMQSGQICEPESLQQTALDLGINLAIQRKLGQLLEGLSQGENMLKRKAEILIKGRKADPQARSDKKNGSAAIERQRQPVSRTPILEKPAIRQDMAKMSPGAPELDSVAIRQDSGTSKRPEPAKSSAHNQGSPMQFRNAAADEPEPRAKRLRMEDSVSNTRAPLSSLDSISRARQQTPFGFGRLNSDVVRCAVAHAITRPRSGTSSLPIETADEEVSRSG